VTKLKSHTNITKGENMPILYPHQQIDRNPEPKQEQKYPNKSWVQYEGKQWQVTGFKLDGGAPMYSLKAPTKDGLGEYATAHQMELSAPNTIAITESDRQANRERVLSEAAKYKRD
jgi:hypothetical protein